MQFQPHSVLEIVFAAFPLKKRGRKKRENELGAFALPIPQLFHSIVNPISAKKVWEKSGTGGGWWQAKGIKQGKCFGGLVSISGEKTLLSRRAAEARITLGR